MKRRRSQIQVMVMRTVQVPATLLAATVVSSLIYAVAMIVLLQNSH
jgi:hypothetical protein